ncbi:MAG: SagB/ThcOx family dehydrogenase [Deltaproteobacteria bacterium]|nr:SagB/ThcOx family dehydrogenase [Deltaproteobacteria bacterium]
MTQKPSAIGFQYLKETRYARDTLRGEPLDQYPRSPLYKTYPPDTPRVQLPPAAETFKADFWRCVQQRRSLRDYLEQPLSLEQLSALLWASQGVTAVQHHFALRAAPSAGALYPVETYVAVHRVEGVKPGIWHFHVPDFSLELVSPGDFRRSLVLAGLNQQFLGTAGVVFIWTGILGRSLWKYRQRAVRYLFLDAGHICGNLHLAATALGLGCCPVAAFFDEEVEQIVHANPEEEIAVYLASVGRLAGRP